MSVTQRNHQELVQLIKGSPNPMSMILLASVSAASPTPRPCADTNALLWCPNAFRVYSSEIDFS